LSSVAADDFRLLRHYSNHQQIQRKPYQSSPQKIPVELALYQPDIAQNTGTMLRLGACLGVHVHIIHPTGFPFSARTVKRGALDYLEHAEFTEHLSWSHFRGWQGESGRRLVLLTTKTSGSIYAAQYLADDILLLGRESAGVPEAVSEVADLKVRIPMRQAMRSLNVAVAASLVLGEALRQTGHFEALT
jgi:tRNA (cytidine/uridine-2'-O-)-methyltransferase